MNLLDLPRDVITLILRMLDRYTLNASATTCTAFAQAREPAIIDLREACRRGCIYSAKILLKSPCIPHKIIQKCIRDAVEYDHEYMISGLCQHSDTEGVEYMMLMGAGMSGRQDIIDNALDKTYGEYAILVGLCDRGYYDLTLKYLKTYKQLKFDPYFDWFDKICGRGDISLCRRLITDPDYKHLRIGEADSIPSGAYHAAKHGYMKIIELLKETFPIDFDDPDVRAQIVGGAIKGSHPHIIEQFMSADMTVDLIIAWNHNDYKIVMWALRNGAQFRCERLNCEYTREENEAIFAYMNIDHIKHASQFSLCNLVQITRIHNLHSQLFAIAKCPEDMQLLTALLAQI